MVIQNKIFSFKIKRQAKNVFPSDVERTVDLFLLINDDILSTYCISRFCGTPWTFKYSNISCYLGNIANEIGPYRGHKRWNQIFAQMTMS